MSTIDMAASKRNVLLAMLAALMLALGMFALAACGSDDSASEESATEAESTATEVNELYADLEPVTMRFGDIAAPGSAAADWAEGICDRVGEITGGKFTIEYFGNGELGTGPDIMRQVQANDLQFFYSEPAMLVPFIPALAVFDQHMMFATVDPEVTEEVLNGDNEFSQKLEEACEDAGVINLGWLQNGTFRQVTSNRELRTLDDYKGFQIRTMDNNNHMAFWSAIGAEPTPLAFAELYFALQNGTVEGEENATDTAVGNNLHEVQKYLCLTNHVLYSGTIVMNKDAWDALDPAYQDALEQAVSECRNEIRPQMAEYDKKNQQTMVDSGMEIIEYDQDFFDTIAANEDVQKLNESIAEQTGGLNEILAAELEKASK